MSVSLSKDRFEATEYGALISWGVIENSPDGVFMTREGPRFLIWGAWKGRADDWAIYVLPFDFGDTVAPWTLDELHSRGDKVHGEEQIAKMVQAEPEVFARYRR